MKIQSVTTPSTTPSFETLLDKMMPHFHYFAKKMKRRYKRFDFDDAIQDLVGIALEMYHSLVRRGKEVFYTPIMKFAIGRYKSGRRFTGSNTTDILSHQTQAMGRSETCQFDDDDDTRYFMKDKQPDIFHAVQAKVDYQDWYHRQSTRDQKIIEDLAMGETTTAVAKKHGVSASFISIKRKGFSNSWNNFINPPEEDNAMCIA
jgi:hypothetical protein